MKNSINNFGWPRVPVFTDILLLGIFGLDDIDDIDSWSFVNPRQIDVEGIRWILYDQLWDKTREIINAKNGW